MASAETCLYQHTHTNDTIDQERSQRWTDRVRDLAELESLDNDLVEYVHAIVIGVQRACNPGKDGETRVNLPLVRTRSR
jgi:hypothetical protein